MRDIAGWGAAMTEIELPIKSEKVSADILG
jgi:hypothetical protein